MRKTKIVCTLGPSTDDEAVLRELILSGMNVARLNMSHGTHEEQKRRADMVKKLRKELDVPVAILLDTKGPEYRIGTFADGKIELHSGDTFTFTTEPVTGNAERVSVSYAGLAQDLEPGNTVLVIEHNLDLIKCADHIIDLGPEGGSAGGEIVAEGTPEQVAEVPGSFTGQYLKPLLEKDKLLQAKEQK